MEEWRDIEGYEGLYQVSNLGRVKSFPRKHSKKEIVILRQLLLPNGYLTCGLWKNNKMRREYIHRLVAKAFIPNPHNLPEVNHKTEDKTDNRAECLEWCTSTYNKNYGTAKQRTVKKLSHKTAQCTLSGEIIKIYPSQKEAVRQTGITNISNVITGRHKTAGGYYWKFVI